MKASIRFLALAVTISFLGACQKKAEVADLATTEALTLASSVFNQGEAAPDAEEFLQDRGVAMLTTSGTDGGFIPGGGTPGGGDGGTIPAPGGGTTTPPSGGSSGGGTTPGTTPPADGGASNGGTVNNGGGSTTPTTPTDPSGGNSGGSSNNGGGSTQPGGNDGGTIPGGSADNGNDGGGINNGGGTIPPGGTTPGNGGGVVDNGGGSTQPGGNTTPTDPSNGGGSNNGGSDNGGSAIPPGGIADNGSNNGGGTTPGGNDGGAVNPGDSTPNGNDGGNTIPGGNGGGIADNGSNNGGTTPGGNSGGGSTDNGGTTPGNGGGSNNGGSDNGGSTIPPGGIADNGSNNGGGTTPGGNDGGTVPGGNSGGGSADGGSTIPPGGGIADNGSNNGGTTPGGNSGGGSVDNGGGSDNGGGDIADNDDGDDSDSDSDDNGHGGCDQNPGQQNQDGCSCKPKQFKVVISRVCSVRRSHSDSLFFEEAKRPILSFEASWSSKESERKYKGRVKNLLASIGFGSPRVKSKMVETAKGKQRFLAASLDLSHVDLFKGKYTKQLDLALSALKSEFKNQWKSMLINVAVCDDKDKDGFCSDEQSKNQLAVEIPKFKAQHIPSTIQIDVWNGRNLTKGDNPEMCEMQYSPLVLDLQGNGIALSGPEAGAEFDLNDTGEEVRTGWVAGRDDALLARDLNKNGKIDSGAELFGSATKLVTGSRAANGFEALKELDSDRDGMITSKDAAWKELVLWLDFNHDGHTDKNELVSLETARLTQISLNYVNMLEVDKFGNETRQRSVYSRKVMGRDKQMLIVDVWFTTLVEQ